MSNTIDISKLDKAEVLAALFNASKQQGMGFLDESGAVPMTVEDARQYTSGISTVNRGGQYYDYLRGRVMKVDLGKDTLNPQLYDRDNGQGAAERALAPLVDQVTKSCWEDLNLDDLVEITHSIVRMHMPVEARVKNFPTDPWSQVELIGFRLAYAGEPSLIYFLDACGRSWLRCQINRQAEQTSCESE
jgi:hypothetical protein